MHRGKTVEDTGHMPSTSQGMPEATRSQDRDMEQILSYYPKKKSTLTTLDF